MEGLAMTTPGPTTGYAAVNGLQLYYEIYGAGRPLVLLHGGLGVTGMFAQLLPALAATRQVIAVELQAHGHTADIARPLSFEHMAGDIAALIGHLGLGTADLCGYSLGGGVALQTAIRHPEVVRKLVILSATYQRKGWYPEVLAGMGAMNAEAAAAMVGSPMHDAYTAAAPRPEDWPVLVDKTGQLLRQDYDWSAGVATLPMPTLIVVGDADSVRTQHAVDMYGLLGGGQADGAMGGLPRAQLAILPGTTHFTILDRLDLLLPIIPPFLDAPPPDAGPQAG
jgi:pimeloyl-ACP methyl ester carboxylesterase